MLGTPLVHIYDRIYIKEERTSYTDRKNAVVLYFKGIELKNIHVQTGVTPRIFEGSYTATCQSQLTVSFGALDVILI
jgi:hypothetical protein